jgi:hypothetical protein
LIIDLLLVLASGSTNLANITSQVTLGLVFGLEVKVAIPVGVGVGKLEGQPLKPLKLELVLPEEQVLRFDPAHQGHRLV